MIHSIRCKESGQIFIIHLEIHSSHAGCGLASGIDSHNRVCESLICLFARSHFLIIFLLVDCSEIDIGIIIFFQTGSADKDIVRTFYQQSELANSLVILCLTDRSKLHERHIRLLNEDLNIIHRIVCTP